MNDLKIKQIGLVVIISAIIFIVAFFFVSGRGKRLGAVDLPYGTNATGTLVTVKNIATEVLPLQSGRAYFRLGNATNTVACVFTNTTTSMTVNAGIIIEPTGLTTSSKTYFDSGEAQINWQGAVNCIAGVTTTLSTFSK